MSKETFKISATVEAAYKEIGLDYSRREELADTLLVISKAVISAIAISQSISNRFVRSRKILGEVVVDLAKHKWDVHTFVDKGPQALFMGLLRARSALMPPRLINLLPYLNDGTPQEHEFIQEERRNALRQAAQYLLPAMRINNISREELNTLELSKWGNQTPLARLLALGILYDATDEFRTITFEGTRPLDEKELALAFGSTDAPTKPKPPRGRPRTITTRTP